MVDPTPQELADQEYHNRCRHFFPDMTLGDEPMGTAAKKPVKAEFWKIKKGQVVSHTQVTAQPVSKPVAPKVEVKK